jgi:hypothetical protein
MLTKRGIGALDIIYLTGFAVSDRVMNERYSSLSRQPHSDESQPCRPKSDENLR